MLRYLSTIIATLVLALSSTGAYAHYWGASWSHIACHWGYCGGGGDGGGSSVPELSLTAGPLAVAVILGIVGIGLERRRRKNRK